MFVRILYVYRTEFSKYIFNEANLIYKQIIQKETIFVSESLKSCMSHAQNYVK